MIAKIAGIRLLTLIPQSEAEQALINEWAESDARIESSCYQGGNTKSILVGFPERKQQKQKQQ